MEISEILNYGFFALVVVAGFFITYLKTRSDIIENAAKWIADAEEQYKDAENAGKLKMKYCIMKLREYVPAYLAAFFTDELIEQLVQQTFDYIRDFATTRLDTVLKSQKTEA